MAVEMSPERFDELVADALDLMPEKLLELLENCIIVVEDEPPSDEPELFGLYDGIPLSERTTQYAGVLPDRISIFRGPLLRYCLDEVEVVAEVRITVLHEIAHFFGIDDHELDELGYA